MSKTLQLFLSSDAVTVGQSTDDKKARTFTGVANSGKPFNYGGQRAIIDLSTLSFHEKVPALLLHDRDNRVGFGTLKVENHQLLMSGSLLGNEQAQKIAQDADDGFPFQMSVHVQAGSTEELTGSQTAEVNGQTVTAPILILRHCKIPEVSFTPTGVDSETSAIVLSDDPSNPNPTSSKGENMNEIEQLKAQISKMQEQIDTLEKENADLKTEKAKAEAEAKKSTVEAELSNKGFSKNEKGEWQGISSTTVDLLLSTDVDKAKAMIADLAPKENKPNIPDFLLSEQHTGGQGQQSTGNPLLDNAIARGKKG